MLFSSIFFFSTMFLKCFLVSVDKSRDCLVQWFAKKDNKNGRRPKNYTLSRRKYLSPFYCYMFWIHKHVWTANEIKKIQFGVIERAITEYFCLVMIQMRLTCQLLHWKTTKFLWWSKLKTDEDNKMDVAKIMLFFSVWRMKTLLEKDKCRLACSFNPLPHNPDF